MEELLFSYGRSFTDDGAASVVVMGDSCLFVSSDFSSREGGS